MDRQKVVLYVIAAALIIAGIALSVFDIVSLSTGDQDLSRHAPFIPAIGLVAIGCCIIFTLRARRHPYNEMEIMPRAEIVIVTIRNEPEPIAAATPAEDSYLHPRHYIGQRRLTAPPGTAGN